MDDPIYLYAPHIAASTKSCIKDMRTTDQTAPIFLDDVSTRKAHVMLIFDAIAF